ncbi:SMI1/KNR4 family protein [Nannocystis pusilla]|uniref:SMI1/KNR4 family protein n=1 Tax=Nannocystis pusilla TaxID=889268 RepID=A0ABS7TVH0_9BACT|nr:SMI1/KNR4 family protein [Nannocystis pusilla]MBZ5712151.1 SMI1/KNR4 family protein [Nannocystis pusilla]
MAKKTGAKGNGGAGGLEELVYGLIAAAAERDLGAVYGAVPAAALDELAAALRPEVEFAGPPSWRAFMAAFGSLRVLDAPGEVVELCVYTPREAAAHTKQHVRVGPGVLWIDDDGSEHAITTDHLVAFADAGGGGQWCFDTSAPGPELPVCCHHADEPLFARKRAGGARVSAEAHDYPDFTAWLRAAIGEFVAAA